MVSGPTRPSVPCVSKPIAVSFFTASSVSNADTNGIMRSSGDGSYIYNMSVNITLNTDYTLIVYPFGTGSPTQYLAHVIQATK